MLPDSARSNVSNNSSVSKVSKVLAMHGCSAAHASCKEARNMQASLDSICMLPCIRPLQEQLDAANTDVVLLDTRSEVSVQIMWW